MGLQIPKDWRVELQIPLSLLLILKTEKDRLRLMGQSGLALDSIDSCTFLFKSALMTFCTFEKTGKVEIRMQLLMFL